MRVNLYFSLGEGREISLTSKDLSLFCQFISSLSLCYIEIPSDINITNEIKMKECTVCLEESMYAQYGFLFDIFFPSRVLIPVLYLLIKAALASIFIRQIFRLKVK